MDARTSMAEHEKVAEIARLKDAGTPLTLDPHRSALLIVDVQRYFVRPDYPFGQVLETLMPGVTVGYFARVRQTVIPNIRRMQARCRARQLPIFYTAAGSYLADGRDLPGWMQGFDQLGLALRGTRVWPPMHDSSWKVDDSLAPLPEEVILNKLSSGPFASTGLDQMLRNMGVETLIVAGLTTDVCVTQAAREAADRGFEVVVVEDGCTALSEEVHRAALLVFGLAFGRVRTTEDVLNLLPTPSADAVQA